MAERKAPAGVVVRESKRNDWQTPEHILERVRLLDSDRMIWLDPATSSDNPTKALRYAAPCHDGMWTLGVSGDWRGVDGLTLDWEAEARGGLTFVNPPYGVKDRGPEWLEAIRYWSSHGVKIVALLGVTRTEQAYMTPMLAEANMACFIRGRVAFRNPDTGDVVSGYCFASWLLGFNMPSARRWREALEPLCGSEAMMAKGEKSMCMELRAL